MLMNEHDDAYVDAMLMVNMQANTRSVTDDYLLSNHLYNPLIIVRTVTIST